MIAHRGNAEKRKYRKTAKPDCRIAGLPDYRIAGLPDYRIADNLPYVR
jgi:hypothetical protein